MKNLAKGGLLAALVMMVVGIFYFQSQAGGATFFLANNSQEINQGLPQEDKKIPAENPVKTAENISGEMNNSKAGKSLNSSSKGMAFSATCYCLRGKTASGAMVRRGIVAADPRVLPLGTRIQVSGSSHSGTYVVADTGGVIKGRIIDIWVPSCAEAIRHGRRKVTVTVLGRGGKSAKAAKSSKK